MSRGRRQEFSVKVRKQALERCRDPDGVPRCESTFVTGHRCNRPMLLGQWRFDHAKADGLGGKPTAENCVVTCIPCDKVKTEKHDKPIMQKADNIRAFHENTRAAPKRPLQSRGFAPSTKNREHTDPFPNLPRRADRWVTARLVEEEENDGNQDRSEVAGSC